MGRDMRAGIKPMDFRFKKPEEKAIKPECPGRNCESSIITIEDILAASEKKPKETSGAEAIAPLFEDIVDSLCKGSSCDACNECGSERKMIPERSEKDPCNGCDGTDCPPLEEAGITCVGIEGMVEKPKKR